MNPLRFTRIALFLLLSVLVAGGCSTLQQAAPSDLPPLLSQDELLRPYVRLGRIQISRETYGSDYSLTPDIKAWGLAAIRLEAEKMGADAVILPEVSGRTTSYGLLPATEYRATGIPIKFK